MGPGNYLVAKKPDGWSGAFLLMEVLLKSLMILLIHDDRNVAASDIDAKSEGGWQYKNKKGKQRFKGLVCRTRTSS